MAQLSKSPKKSLESIQFQGASNIGGSVAAKGISTGNLKHFPIAKLENNTDIGSPKSQMQSSCKYPNC